MARRHANRQDPLTPEQRRHNMSRIRDRDTRPELLIRGSLHRLGFRFRLHDRKLPGTPDLVFPKFRTVIFVHGCFWHGHDCRLGVKPKSNADFWDRKIEGNKIRDAQAETRLVELNWRVATVWECALRGPSRLPLETVALSLSRFIRQDDALNKLFIVRGQQ